MENEEKQTLVTMIQNIKKNFKILTLIYEVVTPKTFKDKHWILTGHNYRTSYQIYLEVILNRLEIDYYDYNYIQALNSAALSFEELISSRFGHFIFDFFDIANFDTSQDENIKKFINKELPNIIDSIINDTFFDLADLQCILEEFMNRVFFLDNFDFFKSDLSLSQKQ